MVDCFSFRELQQDVRELMDEKVLNLLDGQAYDHGKVNEWINSITSGITMDLHRLSPVRRSALGIFH